MPMIKTFLIFENPPPSAFGLDDISSKHILPKPGLTSASLLRSSQRVQLLIPGNTFHTARLIGAGAHRWFLGASTEWPGVVPADVEVGNLDEVAGKYPAVAADLRAIAASVQHVAPTGHFTETRASLSLSPSA